MLTEKDKGASKEGMSSFERSHWGIVLNTEVAKQKVQADGKVSSSARPKLRSCVQR